MKTRTLSLLALLAFGTGTATRAETVLEYKFDVANPLKGGEFVTATTVVPKGSPNAKLMPGSAIHAEATGISDKWVGFLQTGFLRTGLGATKKQFGLKTEPTPDAYKGRNATYSEYFGFSGLGLKEGGDGGALYLVFKPNDTWNKPARRRGLFGTGHTFEGVVTLQANEQKQLILTVGRLRPDDAKNAVTATLDIPWEQNAWYFLAASWQENSAPVLFVRKLAPEGAKASPAGVSGKASGPAPSPTEAPRYDPLVIGASWHNPGSDPSTVDGSDSDIAYVRIDNTHATEADIQKIFLSLANE